VFEASHVLYLTFYALGPTSGTQVLRFNRARRPNSRLFEFYPTTTARPRACSGPPRPDMRNNVPDYIRNWLILVVAENIAMPRPVSKTPQARD